MTKINIMDKFSKIIHFLFEKVLTWPIVTLIIFLLLYMPIKSLIPKTSEIKFGEFQITVDKIGRSLGISNIIKDINDLSYDELKIFLIIGGEDSDYYIFEPKNLPSGKFKEICSKLVKKGLIDAIDVNSIKGISEDYKKRGIGFKTTEKGRIINRAILDAIFDGLIQTKIQN